MNDGYAAQKWLPIMTYVMVMRKDGFDLFFPEKFQDVFGSPFSLLFPGSLKTFDKNFCENVYKLATVISVIIQNKTAS